jgi:hypothetical protein
MPRIVAQMGEFRRKQGKLLDVVAGSEQHGRQYGLPRLGAVPTEATEETPIPSAFRADKHVERGRDGAPSAPPPSDPSRDRTTRHASWKTPRFQESRSPTTA